jgi:hypothetical protein
MQVSPWTTKPGGEIKTPVIPPQTFWPLVRACWTYIHTFAPDITAARDEIALLDTPDTVRRGPRLSAQEIDAALDGWLSSPHAFVPLHIYTLGRATAGDINWDGLALCTTPRLNGPNFYGSRGPARQLGVHRAISRGVPTRYGYTSIQPTSVDRLDGTRAMDQRIRPHHHQQGAHPTTQRRIHFRCDHDNDA